MILTEQEAKLNLRALIEKYNNLSADDRKTTSEASVVRQFVDELLENVLGWPVKDPARYRYEQVTQVGRPDIMLIPEKGGTIFVEAKKFGVIKELEQARKDIRGVVTPGQLALPGMAVDRTPEEQQAINYAFSNNGTWAILTNFEKLRLFNARRDWLVLSFEKPIAYIDEFDLLWQLAYQNIINGSLDTLNNQRVTAEIDTDYLRFINEWREKLAQDIVERRADNPWAFSPDGEIDLVILRAVVQRVIDRLVLTRFAEDHLVLPPGTLRSFYELGQSNIYADINQLLRTFFRRFDQTHNSALFAHGLADQVVFSDKVLIALLSKLYEARYRSMPADIMGNTYEQYLGKTLVRANGSIKTSDNLETRKKQGSYYTPQVIVRYIVDNSLGRYLYATENGKPDGTPITSETRKTSADIRSLRILDSACGSGSFLIYAYQVLDQFYESEKSRLQAEFDRHLDELSHQGMMPNDMRIELKPLQNEMDRIQIHQRLILEAHLYGVDLDPQAAEIAVVNLMMRGMERRYAEKRLPLILNQNVKVGNALIGLRPNDPRLAQYTDQIATIRQLRANLIATPNDTTEHDRIIRDLETATALLTRALDEPLASEFDNLGAIRPFHWAAEFPEVFFDQQGQQLENPGFTIIFGNPPWEILKPDLREFYAQFDSEIESKLNRQQVEARIEQLEAEDPRRKEVFLASVKVVEQTSAYVRQSGNYTMQGRGDIATHKLFLEQMYKMLNYGGRIGYVIPAGIYRDLGTKELREMLFSEGNVQYMFSFSNEKTFFSGVHHDFRFTMLGAQKGDGSEAFKTTFRFNPRVAIKPDELLEFLSDSRNLIYMTRESISRFSPDSLSIMEFQAQSDYSLTEAIFKDISLLGDILDGVWNTHFTREIDLNLDRKFINTEKRGLPLYQGKMIHQYDAYFLESPEYWIDEKDIPEDKHLPQQNGILEYQQYRLGFRGVSNATNARTLICAIIPSRVFAESMFPVIDTSKAKISYSEQFYVLGVLNSFLLDWILKKKVSVRISHFFIYQLPVPRIVEGNPYFDAIVPRAAQLTCTRSEFAGLWEEVMGTPWDESKGATGPAERQRLRDEIDAIVAHLYGLSREDFDHILSTFPLVFPDNEAGRAKRVALLAVYDEWQA